LKGFISIFRNFERNYISWLTIDLEINRPSFPIDRKLVGLLQINEEVFSRNEA